MYHQAIDERFQVDAGQNSGEPIWFVSDAAYERAVRRAMRERSRVAGELARKLFDFLRRGR